MTLSKPFRRIIRPFTDGEYLHGAKDDEIYILNNSYAPDRSSLVRAYSIIERNLIQLFDYVEPSDHNLKIYSHRTYELLLRASTEFETNCKSILTANNYTRSSGGNLNITDYYKIDGASKLSEYSIILDAWLPRAKVFQPFKDWATGHSLAWYQSYNTVKHNRGKKFREASLTNVMMSITGLLVILFSQFYVFAFNPYQSIGSYTVGDDDSIYIESSLFRIIPPSTWSSSEQYDFDWSAIKASRNRFYRFRF